MPTVSLPAVRVGSEPGAQAAADVGPEPVADAEGAPCASSSCGEQPARPRVIRTAAARTTRLGLSGIAGGMAGPWHRPWAAVHAIAVLSG